MPEQQRRAVAVRQQIDALCDEFEQLWQDDSRPDLASFLLRIEAGERGKLLRELVALDCEYRRERGETPAAADYQSAASEHAQILAELFAEPSYHDESTQARLADTHPAPSRPHPDAPETLPEVPGYEVLGFVAQGGMGVVYHARDRQLAREVALKMPRSGYLGNSQEKERFVREAVAAAKVRHANICPVFEVREVNGQPYIAMAFIRGVTLKVWRQQAAPKPRQIADLLATVARAVQAAHDQGLIHRDLKPSNVMVENGSGEPMLMDFGLAKDLSSTDGLTMTGDVLGTPAYMAPEQAAGKLAEIGKHSDIYSLGAILYELLSGNAPFSGTLAEMLQQVQNSEPVSIRKTNPQVHRDLETICLKAMTKRPAERYASAGAMAEDLERFSSGEPILARRHSLVTRAARQIQKHKAVAALVLVLTLGVVALPMIQRQVASARRTHAINTLTRKLQDNLQTADWAPGQLPALEKLKADLAALDPEEAAQFEPQIEQRLEGFLKEKSSLPLDVFLQHRPQIEAAITALEARQAASVATWKAFAARQFGSYQVSAALKGPYSQAPPLIPDLVPSSDGQGLISPPDAGTRVQQFNLGYYPTTQAGADYEQIAATFHLPPQALAGVALNVKENLSGGISTLAISPDSQFIAVGSDQAGPIRIWDSAQASESFALEGHTAGVAALAFGADGKLLLSTSIDRQLKVWDLVERKLLQTIQVDEPVKDEDRDFLNTKLPLALPKARDRVYVGGQAGIRCYSLPEMKLLSKFPEGTHISSLSISDDGTRLVSASWNRAVRMWDTQTEKVLWTNDIEAWRDVVLALSPDGKLLATSSSRHLIRIHDTGTGHIIDEVQSQEGIVFALAFDPTGKRLAASHQHAVLNVWDLKSKTLLNSKLARAFEAAALAYDPAGKWLVYGTRSGHLYQHDATTGQERWTLSDQAYSVYLQRALDGDSLQFDLYRNGIHLRQVNQPLSGSVVKVTVQREQDQLHVQVNQNPPVVFFDYLAPRVVTGGKLCVVLGHEKNRAELRELTVAQRSEKPEDVSPLEHGNREFRHSQFAAALDFYEALLASPSNRLTPEVQQEARLKSAFCLMRLNRVADAELVLQELAATAGEPTPFVTLARVHLWATLAERKQWSAVEPLAELIQVQHPFEKLSEVVPRDVHDRLFDCYWQGINRRSAMALAGAAKRLAAAERLVQYLRLDFAEDQHHLLAILYEGLRMTGQDAAARRLGIQYLTLRLPFLEQAGLQPHDEQRDFIAIWHRNGATARWLKQPEFVEQALDRLLYTPAGALKPEVKGKSYGLLLERARLHAHREQWDKALQLAEKCWVNRRHIDLELENRLHFALLYGIALQKLQRPEEAQAIYRKMREDPELVAALADVSNQAANDLLEILVLCGLLGEFDEKLTSDVADFAALRLGTGTATSLLSVIPLTPATMNAMFKSRRGQQFAATIAQGDALAAEQIKGLMMLYGYQTIRQGAFVEATPYEDELIWNLAETGFKRYTENTLSMPTFLQLGLAWKGIPAPLGWKFAFAGVPDDMRAPCAYILARRFQFRESPEIANSLFKLTVEYAADNAELRKLAEDRISQPTPSPPKPAPNSTP